MRHAICLRGWLVGGIACGWLALAVGRGQAAEEAWRFLEGLRERGYYDMALEYLDRVETSPRCPEDLKEQIDYQKGVTLVLRSALSGTAREDHLDQAHDAFQKFLQEHPKHALAAKAHTQLANALAQQAEGKVERASRASTSAEEKKQLLAEARRLYQQAQKSFVEAEKLVYQRAKVLEEEAKRDSRKIEERDATRRELMQARLYLATVLYEIGKTYAPESKEYKEHLGEAAKKYEVLYDKWNQFAGGLYARMQEGRIRKDLGEPDKAVEIFKQLRGMLGGGEGERALSNQTLGLLLETYLASGVEKYAQAVAEAQKWQATTRGAEESSPTGLKIHFLAGKAALLLAEGRKENDPKRKAHLKAARQHLEFVTRFRGEFQREAKNLLAHELLGGEIDTGEPETFADARDRGHLAWDTMLVALAKSQDAQTEEEKNKSTAEMHQARDEALRYYRLALGLKPDQTPIVELNVLRFRLTYLYWMIQDYYRAAVMGEFLATHYPQSMGAPQGAEIAIKAYHTLYALSPKRKEERTFETRRMAELANLITTRWPDQPQADEAWMVLLDTAVDNRDLAQAEECLAKINAESPRRAEAELRLGQALWASYVEASNRPSEERPPQEKLDELIGKAQQTLQQGIARMRKSVEQGGSIEYALCYSVLALAQIHIGAGQSEEAVKWLDDPKVGPMTLVATDHPATDKPNFRIEVYKAALRAYVGAQLLDKAEQTMDALEAAVAAGGDAGAARKLTEIYIMLGRELQETLKRLRQENKSDEAEKVARGFEIFLSRISGREGNTFSSLNWVAETFYNLGAALDPEDEPTPEKAKTYYKSAANTYVKILDTIKKDEQGDFAPAGASTNTLVRLAVCLRALDMHKEAMTFLVKILKERPTRVDVQIEAARTYQDWAKMKGKSGYYRTAINGGNKVDGRNLVWGWGMIARRVAPFDKFRDTFHEARYNLALCRLKLAQHQQGSEKTKTLKAAEREITSVYLLYPRMGGETWYPKYDSLLKTVQRLLGKKPVGLGGGQRITSAANKPAKSTMTPSR